MSEYELSSIKVMKFTRVIYLYVDTTFVIQLLNFNKMFRIKHPPPSKITSLLSIETFVVGNTVYDKPGLHITSEMSLKLPALVSISLLTYGCGLLYDIKYIRYKTGFKNMCQHKS